MAPQVDEQCPNHETCLGWLCQGMCAACLRQENIELKILLMRRDRELKELKEGGRRCRCSLRKL